MGDALPVVGRVDDTREHADERVVIHSVSWEQYEALLGILGDRSGLRLTYLDEALEIMSPSFGHERVKTMIARLLEAWAVETATPLNGYGSATQRNRATKRGAEPDEWYALGRILADDHDGDPPDLAVEVFWSRGGLDRLEVYRGLRVPEVWLIDARAAAIRIDVHRLRRRGYERVERSELLPSLDLGLLCRFVNRPDGTEATIEYLAALRASR